MDSLLCARWCRTRERMLGPEWACTDGPSLKVGAVTDIVALMVAAGVVEVLVAETGRGG